MATQAPQASRRAAPSAATKVAAIVTWIYAACFGLPAIAVAVYLLRTGRLPLLFDAFPVYGGPWYDSGRPEGFAAQHGAFLVMMLVVSWGGWLLWRGSRAGVVVAVATIPVEALFWYGFALPIPPLLTPVRVVLVIAASMRPKSPCARQTASPGLNAATEGIPYDDVSRAGARNGDSYRRRGLDLPWSRPRQSDFTNLSISAQFYTEVLGFTVVFDFGYALACMHETTGFTLSLIRHPDGTGTRFTHRQTGLDHLALTARNRAELLYWE